MLARAPSHEIIVIRHGQTDWNAGAILQGREDIPLNDTGRAQARRNGEALRSRFDRFGIDPDSYDWIASPLSRAAETMRLVREAAHLDPLAYRTDDRLMELDFGRWSGLNLQQIQQSDPAGYAARQKDRWNIPPTGGESSVQAIDRLGPLVSALDRPTVLVTHGGVNRVLKVMLGALTVAQALEFHTPQDRFYVWSAGQVEWV
jgi:broad specificity phosphatase PhoE